MNPIPLSEIVRVVSGQAGAGVPDAMVSAICTDTRQLRAGALFVAIIGETHDGHNYLADAQQAGAVAAVVEQTEPSPQPSPKGRGSGGSKVTMPLIRVPSTRAALGQLAAELRKKLKGTVIAVGGSNGKTGTKNLIDSVLGTCRRGSMSPKSFNNDIGVPLAVFPANEDDDYLVLELGTNHPGELRPLSLMSRPDIAVITNCMAEHLEGFGDIDGVRREETSIIDGLDPEGLLVVNADDPAVLRAVARHPGPRVTFGLRHSNDLYATEIACDFSGVQFRLNGGRRLYIPLLGQHVAVNALAAIAVARRLGLSDDRIAEGLLQARGPEMRLQLQKVRGVTFINDAYNANPGSMEAAIKTLCGLPATGRRVAVVGDMRELGAASDEAHRQLGAFLATCPLDAIVCVGEKAALIAQSAAAGGFDKDRISHFADAKAAAKAVPQALEAGDLVLVKGSRTMRMETILEM